MWELVAGLLPVLDRLRGARPLKHGHRLVIDTILLCWCPVVRGGWCSTIWHRGTPPIGGFGS
jgi:hypothetical protein